MCDETHFWLFNVASNSLVTAVTNLILSFWVSILILYSLAGFNSFLSSCKFVLVFLLLQGLKVFSKGHSVSLRLWV